MGERVVSALSALSMIALLAACQQQATKITHKEPGSMLVQYPAPDGTSTNLSYFPRWNHGSIEMAQGDKSGPVKGAYAGASAGSAPSSNATLPVNYASKTAATGAGSEASSYYMNQPLGAARIGGAQPAPAPMAVASAAPARITSGLSAQTAPAGYGAHAYAPIPLKASPFGRPSAPLEPQVALLAPAPLSSAAGVAPTQAQLASANANAGMAPVVPINSVYAPSAPSAHPRASVVQDGTTKSQFAAMLAGEEITPTYASASASDYSGSIPLGGAMMAAPSANTASVQPANMAAPSLPMHSEAVPEAPVSTVSQATAAPVPAGSIHSNGSDNFVIQAKSSGVVIDGEDEDEIVDAAKASPVKPVSETTMAGSADLKWPVQGSIISRFGPKAGGKSNDGVNIAAPVGTPIKAAADGMVIYAGNELQGYGNMLVISHDAGRATVYAHAQQLKVRKGQFVKQGQLIANVGQTGGVSQPQLHFAVREGSTPVDPMALLQKKVASK